MAKTEKDAKKHQQENKTPELAAAKKALEMYFKENKLDPTKDYTKDKVHGKKVTKLLAKLNKERDKVAAQYPESDARMMKHLKNKAKKEVEKEVKVDKIQKVAKEKMAVHTKYDYPLIDGKEMTAEQKKKYRAEQRKAKASGTPKDNASSSKPSKKAKEESKPAKPSKADKKAKKAKKEED